MSDDIVKIQIGSKWIYSVPDFDLTLSAETDPVLFTKCTDVDLTQVEYNTKLATAMRTLCQRHMGLGLSANQVGIPKNMFVLGLDSEYASVFNTVFINPVIIELSKKTVAYEEGCLSFKHIVHRVFRPETVRLQWYDLQGNHHIFTYDAVIARVILHEMEHLNGGTILDHMTPFERRRKFEQRAKRMKRVSRQ